MRSVGKLVWVWGGCGLALMCLWTSHLKALLNDWSKCQWLPRHSGLAAFLGLTALNTCLTSSSCTMRVWLLSWCGWCGRLCCIHLEVSKDTIKFLHQRGVWVNTQLATTGFIIGNYSAKCLMLHFVGDWSVVGKKDAGKRCFFRARYPSYHLCELICNGLGAL